MANNSKMSWIKSSEVSVFFSGILSSVISVKFENLFTNASSYTITIGQEYGLIVTENDVGLMTEIIKFTLQLASFILLWLLVALVIWPFVIHLYEQKKHKEPLTRSAQDLCVVIPQWATRVIRISEVVRSSPATHIIILHFVEIAQLVVEIERSMGQTSKSKLRSSDNFSDITAVSIYASDYQLIVLLDSIIELVTLMQLKIQRVQDLKDRTFIEMDMETVINSCTNLLKFLHN